MKLVKFAGSLINIDQIASADYETRRVPDHIQYGDVIKPDKYQTVLTVTMSFGVKFEEKFDNLLDAQIRLHQVTEGVK